MATPKRTKSGGYHGIEEMKFVPKVDDVYKIDAKLPILYAKNLNLNVILAAAEQYADNILLFRVPKDDGYEGEIGSTAPDYELEKALGYALEGEGGLIRTNMAYYSRGALYYEFKETDKYGRDSVTKVWLYSAELGKGSENLSSDTNSISFGEYKYPLRVYGDKVMASDGTKEYRDEKGLGRTTSSVGADDPVRPCATLVYERGGRPCATLVYERGGRPCATLVYEWSGRPCATLVYEWSGRPCATAMYERGGRPRATTVYERRAGSSGHLRIRADRVVRPYGYRRIFYAPRILGLRKQQNHHL